MLNIGFPQKRYRRNTPQAKCIIKTGITQEKEREGEKERERKREK
jgi:hypothetical protein